MNRCMSATPAYRRRHDSRNWPVRHPVGMVVMGCGGKVFYDNSPTRCYRQHDGDLIGMNAIWPARGRIKDGREGAKSLSQAYLQYILQGVHGEGAKLYAVGDDEAEKDQVAVPIEATDAAPKMFTDDVPPARDYCRLFEVTDDLDGARCFRAGKVEFIDIRMDGPMNPEERALRGSEQVRVRARSIEALGRSILGFVFHDSLGHTVFGENTPPCTENTPFPVLAGEDLEAVFQFRLPMLSNGDYVVHARASSQHRQWDTRVAVAHLILAGSMIPLLRCAILAVVLRAGGALSWRTRDLPINCGTACHHRWLRGLWPPARICASRGLRALARFPWRATFVWVAEGEPHNSAQRYLLLDALILNVSSSNARPGFVGATFERVGPRVCE